jgi:hypothetical protein
MSENSFFWLMAAVEISLSIVVIFALFSYIKKRLGKINLGFDQDDHDKN